MKYESVFWDFDGVWSKDWFYKSLKDSHPQVWEFIQTKIWGPNGESRVDRWMRAELSMKDINQLVAQETGIDFNLLTKTFLGDIAKMEIEIRHVPIVEELKRRRIKVGMITNNMDVFTTITVSRLNLLDLFSGRVYNSFDHRMLKAEGLFDLAICQTGAKYSTSLLIDDSPRARSAFEALGGHAYPYTTFTDFQSWTNQNLLS
jgi:FMN phosphatase YigB (HAD superfamily)